MPVVHQAGGYHHQRARQFAAACQFAQHQRGFDGFAQADLVRDEVAARRRRGHPMRQHHLVRQQVDLGRSERRRTIHQWQGVRLVAEPGVARPLGRALDCRQHAVCA